MFSLRACGRGLRAACALNVKFSRTFFSDRIRCHEAWAKRLDTPIFQKVKLDEMFIELDAKLNATREATPVDIDIFANALNDGSRLDELDDLLHRFRMSSSCGKTLASTHHAVVRAFLEHGDPSELLRILNDRLNYGIFPDDYTNVILLDHFIKKQDFTSAAKVASMRMLQEDFSSDLLNYLSLFSCHKYLLNPTEWEPPAEPEPEDDEEVRVRVHYIRNPYFDDHFDLTDPNALVGKTFHYIGRVMADNTGANYRALGLVLHKKWDDATKFIAESVAGKVKFYSQIVELMDKFIGSLPEEEQKGLEDLKAAVSSARGSAVGDDLLQEVSDKIKSLVQIEEPKIVNQQPQVFLEWENTRENVLKAELEAIRKKQRLAEVENKKQQLRKEEEEIFFFDNEDKIDLSIENKRVRYPKKWPGKKKKKREVGVEYVPPEIVTKKPWVQ